MKIIPRDIPPRAAWALEQAGIHPLLAQLYAARGVLAKEELDDGLVHLLPPAGLKGAHAAADTVGDAAPRGRARGHHRVGLGRVASGDQVQAVTREAGLMAAVRGRAPHVAALREDDGGGT